MLCANLANSFYDATDALLDITINKATPESRTSSFSNLLELTKGLSQANLKLLAADAIPKYFKYFPTLQLEAIDAFLDLCEDEDAKVRKESIKNLILLCQDSTHVTRVTDVLLQLLQVEGEEKMIASKSLLDLFQRYPRQVLDAIFHRLEDQDVLVRSGISLWIPTLVSSCKMTKPIGDELSNSLVKVVVHENVTAEELGACVKLFLHFKTFENPQVLKSVTQSLNRLAGSLKLNVELSSEQNMEAIVGIVNAVFPMLQKKFSGLLLLDRLLENIIADPSFIILSNQDQSRVLKLACELAQFSPLTDAHLTGLVQMIQNFNSDSIDVLKAEPFMYLLYHVMMKCQSEISSTDSTVLRQVLLNAQLCKDELLKSSSEDKETLQKSIKAAGNVVLLVKEILKPAKARVLVTCELSWKKVVTKRSPEKPTQPPKKAVKTKPQQKPQQKPQKPAKKKELVIVGKSKNIKIKRQPKVVVIGK